MVEEPERVCQEDVACAQSERCVNRRCVPAQERCDEDSDCGTGRFCLDGVCGRTFALECRADEDCGEPGECESAEGAQCVSGQCVYLHLEGREGCDPCEGVVCEAREGGCLVGRCVGERRVAQCRYARAGEGAVCEVEGAGGVCQKGQCRLDEGPPECEDYNPCTTNLVEGETCVFEVIEEGPCLNEDGREGVCERGLCKASPD